MFIIAALFAFALAIAYYHRIINYFKSEKRNLVEKEVNPFENDEDTWKSYLLFGQGKKAFLEKKYDQALIFLNDPSIAIFLSKKTNIYPEFYELRGLCYQHLNDEYNAVENFLNAIKHSSNVGRYYFQLSVSLTSIREHYFSSESLKRAIEFAENDKDRLLYEICLDREQNIIEVNKLGKSI